MATKHPAGDDQHSKSAQDRKRPTRNDTRDPQDTRGAHHNPGNFANDPEKARKAGRKGGQS